MQESKNLKSTNWIKSLGNRPIALAVLGWIFFPGMYLIVGIMTAFKINPKSALLIASPLGILGLIWWILAIIVSLRLTILKTKPVQAILGLILSIPPILFLAYGYYVAASGGV